MSLKNAIGTEQLARAFTFDTSGLLQYLLRLMAYVRWMLDVLWLILDVSLRSICS
jgi:hypothetical protein